MGFSNREQTAGKFVNFKEGKFKVGDALFTDWDNVRVIDMDITDEDYEGIPYRKITLFVDDEGELKELGFSLSSGYGNAFCCIAPNVDWSEIVSFSAKTKKKNGKNYTGMFIRQRGKPVKWYYTKATDEKTKRPLAKEIKTGKGKMEKITYDFSDRNEFYETKLMKIREIIKKATGGLAEFKPKPKEKNVADFLGEAASEEVPF